MMARRDGGRGDCCELGSASAMKDMGDARTAADDDDEEDEDDDEEEGEVEDEDTCDDAAAAELRDAIAEAADCWCCARKEARESP